LGPDRLRRKCARENQPLNEPALKAAADVSADDVVQQDPPELQLLVGFVLSLIGARGGDDARNARLEGVVERGLDLMKIVLAGQGRCLVLRDVGAFAGSAYFFDLTTVPVVTLRVKMSCSVTSAGLLRPRSGFTLGCPLSCFTRFSE